MGDSLSRSQKALLNRKGNNDTLSDWPSASMSFNRSRQDKTPDVPGYIGHRGGQMNDRVSTADIRGNQGKTSDVLRARDHRGNHKTGNMQADDRGQVKTPDSLRTNEYRGL